MTIFVHKVNPHYSATHADIYFEGFKYFVSFYKDYPIEPGVFNTPVENLDVVEKLGNYLDEEIIFQGY